MGITGLWDVLGSGTIVSLAEYAAKHHELHSRPLRVAIDEAGWRFNNLTDFQVAQIREKEPAANPIEKTILWRLLVLLKLNIQPLFVFDGPQRPNKRGRRGGNKVDYDRLKLLKQLLDHLGVPYHHAKGEAEAECAFLQQHNVVDAVWTDDGDAFMFGATKIIKYCKVGGKRETNMIQVYEASEVLGRLDFDKESVVLFALLAGGDYDVKGLPGCGPKNATKLATKSCGLARAICQPSTSMPVWRCQLHDALRICREAISVPNDFPNPRALRYYLHPTVSSAEDLRDLRCLRRGWQREINQPNLRTFLRQRFNFSTREYMNHIAPIFMTRALLNAVTSAQRAKNDCYAVQVKPRRASKKDANQTDEPNSEVKITFNAAPAVGFDVATEPVDSFGKRLEDWSELKGKKKASTWSPSDPVECETLECFLRRGLSESALEVAFNPTKVKTSKGHASKASLSKRKRPAPADAAAGARTSISKKRRKRTTESLSSPSGASISASLNSVPAPSPLQSASGFRVPQSREKGVHEPQRPLWPDVLDLCSDSESSDSESNEDGIRPPWGYGPPTLAARETAVPNSAAPESNFQPGLACDPDMLRKRRMEGLSAKQVLGTPTVSTVPSPTKLPPQPSCVEIIDLT